MASIPTSSSLSFISNPSSSNPSLFLPLQIPLLKTTNYPLLKIRDHTTRFSTSNLKALEREQYDTPLLLQEDLDNQRVEESIKVLKNAAKTRRVPAEEVLSALAVIKKAKIDSSEFLNTLGGSESPGRTWMLIFTTQERLKSGSYFPITAVQRFDAAAKRIENGVYLGPVGSLTFEGRFSWEKRMLAFIFEFVRIKFGSLGPLQISLGKREEREPSTKDPFFIWFYVDEEIAVAQGKGGGTAFWCRCRCV
ncbi:microbial collagenase [Tasmannia lanceolata]|uniref:microbial collagenase n=1 Tax=Tasmannia lanceolata TaxID=3420 RepID=UPI00406431F5